MRNSGVQVSVCLTRRCSRWFTEGDTNFETSNEGAGNELILIARRKEQRLHVRHQLSVHAGHLELVLEVADRAQTPHDHLAAVGDDEVAQEAAKCDHLDVGVLAGQFLGDLQTLRDGEHRALVMSRSNRRLARRIRSSWPSVIGSKVPG